MNRSITVNGHVQINRYDAEGLRYEMEENGRLVQLIFNTEKEVVTEERAGEVTRLIRGRELIARSTDSTRTYYHYASDEMGSITHLADEAGAIQNQYAYDAWGNFLTKEEKIPNRYTYYGQQFDQITQQYYLRARFYNPVFGRFTQEDTYRGDGLNLYAYCANNPVRYIDPSGFYKDAIESIINHEKAIEIPEQSKEPILNRKQVLHLAQDMLGIPHSQQPIRQWIVGGDIHKKGYDTKNYVFHPNETHHGRFYEYVTDKGLHVVVVEHINDGMLHFHSGILKTDTLTYDFRHESYQKVVDKNGEHHIYYKG